MTHAAAAAPPAIMRRRLKNTASTRPIAEALHLLNGRTP
jgi:hypothetical protein